jgi:DNA-binding NarL/FixJ family response regulator
MSRATNLRILIADDHELIRRGIRDLLAAKVEWHVVAEASQGLDAVRLAAKFKPDLAILDFSMPYLNGPQVAMEIAHVSTLTRVIFLTMHDSEQTVREALKSGATGFVLKSDADQNLLRAVEAVSQGRNFFTSHVVELLRNKYLEEKGPSRVEPEKPLITAREREVMALLASGMTNREIAAQLKISIRTAESHRININHKLSFKSMADLMRYALREVGQHDTNHGTS